jgi:CheY-like chemotaxis protein
MNGIAPGRSHTDREGLNPRQFPADAEPGEKSPASAPSGAGRGALIRAPLMNCKEIDLNRILANQEQSLRRLMGENVTVTLGYSAKPAMVNADEAMLGQILAGLAENARAAMPDGGRLDVQAELIEVDDIHARFQAGARPGLFVRLSVADSGCGISAREHRKLFQASSDTARRSGGEGLGLPVIAGIIKRRHGWIELVSQPGAGATFRIFLPQASPATAQDAQSSWAAETILLVDDEAAMRGMIRNALQRASYDVIEADTGVQALSVWEQNKGQVNVLLTDMVMPDGINGRDLARRLKASKPGLKVIYTSGYDLDEAANKDRAKEGFRFLQKPYDMRELLATVQETLSPAATANVSA